MNTALPPLAIPDLHTGTTYLAQLPLANPPLAERQLADFLDALLAKPPTPDILMTLLEQARVPMHFVAEEMARRHHSKALPLSDDEERCFQQVLAGWQRMGQAYALCARLQEPAPGSPQYATLVATIVHRCLNYTGMVIVEHFRARREVPAGIWHDLHGYYETAEQWGVVYTPVNDSLESQLQATHCAAAYVTLLLIEVANPYGNSVRNLNLIRRWASLWAPLVSLHRLDDDYEVPPYIVELMTDLPIHPTGADHHPGADARRLDTSRLGLQISHMLAQLHQRMTPSQLGLGEETSGHVIQLLEQICRPWTQAAAPRRFRRFASEGSARVAIGFDAMHFFVGGEEFAPPDSGSLYSRAEFEELFTFREQALPGQALNIKPKPVFPSAEWSVINHSANGFRLARSQPGERIIHSQLLAVCPHDGERFLLGQATWLMQERCGSLVVGVSVLPGLPEAVGVRQAPSVAGHADRYVRGFLLPPVAAIGEEASLVIPSGMYQASGTLEIYADGKSRRLRMMRIRQGGSDFDRVSYEAL